LTEATVDIRMIAEGGPAPVAPRRGRRGAWIIRRIMAGFATIAGVSVLVFVATQVLPGNAARQLLGRNATPENVRIVERELGLQKPIVAQYGSWVGNAIQGDFGRSLTRDRLRVSALLADPIANSAVLVILSAVLGIGLGLVLGITAASRQGGLVDAALMGIAFVFTAVPEFVVALLLAILFATSVFEILPAISSIPPGESPFANLTSYVLPVATLVLATIPYIGRLVRASVIDAMDSEYVRMARLKGLDERRILFRHALPNAIVPTIQGIAVIVGYLAGGVVLVEYVFGFPGVGTELVNAIQARDIPTVQALGLLLAAVYVAANVLADIAVVYASPRTRTALR
jgi:peptide/nickel transport system permease protein